MEEGYFSLPYGSLTSSPKMGSPGQLYPELQSVGIQVQAHMFLRSASWGELNRTGRNALMGVVGSWERTGGNGALALE